jgi:hypothetical protein
MIAVQLFRNLGHDHVGAPHGEQNAQATADRTNEDALREQLADDAAALGA